MPPGALGNRLLNEVCADVEPLVAAAAQHLTGEPVALDVAVDGQRRPTSRGTRSVHLILVDGPQ